MYIERLLLVSRISINKETGKTRITSREYSKRVLVMMVSYPIRTRNPYKRARILDKHYYTPI